MPVSIMDLLGMYSGIGDTSGVGSALVELNDGDIFRGVSGKTFPEIVEYLKTGNYWMGKIHDD